MRFKSFQWPHNPQTYTITYTREVVSHKIPFGRYQLQSLGISHRVMKGVGEFTGQGAYDTFKELATLFYEESPGVLVHPVWQTTQAWLVDLKLEQAPRRDYVKYSFTFWECPNGASQISGSSLTAAALSQEAEYHTVLQGETLWAIAQTYSTTVSQLLALNPALKSPNHIQPGDRLLVREGMA